MGTCRKCFGQYVGKTTQELRERHSGHKQDIKKKMGGLGNHYHPENGCGYQNLEIMIIDQVTEGNEDQLRDKELFWQHQLLAFHENGGNGHCVKNETDSYRK